MERPPGTHAPRADSDVLELVRRGDRLAYVVLYERHVRAARRLARSLLRNDADADDVVAEVFTSVLAVIQRGKGPRDHFAPYLMSSIRNECLRVRRRRSRTAQLATPDDALGALTSQVEHDPFAGRDDVAVLRDALRELPPHAREVLWRTEVEGLSHQEIADTTGTTTQAVAARAMRARRALGGAYLRGHLGGDTGGDPLPRACADTRRRLPDFVRDAASRRSRRRVEAHLSTCESCRQARDELERVNRRLRTAPGLPLAAGAGILNLGLKARLAGWLATSGAPVVAATSLVVVSAVVPLTVARRHDDGTQQVATVDEPPAAVDAQPAVAASLVERAPSGDHGVDDETSSDPVPTRPPNPGDPPDQPPATTPPTTPPSRRARPTPAPGRTSPPGAQPPATAAPPGPTAPEGATPPPISVPAISVPAVSTPAVTLPPVSLPPVSLPPVSVPGVSTPAVSLPPVSLPLVTVPSITVPSITVPPITVPSITVPSITVPSITVPSVSLPSVTLPPVTLPRIGG